METDATYVGGKARNLHAHRRQTMKPGHDTRHKTARRGQGPDHEPVTVLLIPDASAASLTGIVSGSTEPWGRDLFVRRPLDATHILSHDCRAHIPKCS